QAQRGGDDQQHHVQGQHPVKNRRAFGHADQASYGPKAQHDAADPNDDVHHVYSFLAAKSGPHSFLIASYSSGLPMAMISRRSMSRMAARAFSTSAGDSMSM